MLQATQSSCCLHLLFCSCCCSRRHHLVEAFKRRPKAASGYYCCCCDVDFLSAPSLIRGEGTPHHALRNTFRTSGDLVHTTLESKHSSYVGENIFCPLASCPVIFSNPLSTGLGAAVHCSNGRRIGWPSNQPA